MAHRFDRVLVDDPDPPGKRAVILAGPLVHVSPIEEAAPFIGLQGARRDHGESGLPRPCFSNQAEEFTGS